ncbi:hypothetical protein SAMN05421807_13120 [Virgibacillus chiguensis]|uniref:Uncharacterized protein n=1 Tax=Virgibacillus chiguensis TaxID=411959 RepID=A0A1M5XQD7_9BACI|nr:hypothetical protein SAMN05421807_13120 [Virgibacillus chiguensis]
MFLPEKIYRILVLISLVAIVTVVFEEEDLLWFRIFLFVFIVITIIDLIKLFRKKRNQ